MNAGPVGERLDVERQARALIDLVEADSRRQCDEVLGEANGRAATARADAGRIARSRMREVFAEQRRRHEGQLVAALARLATRRRLHAQRRTAALLLLGWQQLPGALRAQWQQPDSRIAWARHLVAQAVERLQPGPWRIVHAPGWPVEEQQQLARSLPGEPAGALRFEADASIDAGLRIVAGSNVLDGTIAGLLADRAEIEAGLLDRLEPAESAQGGPT
jgi:hypothetical protein